MAAGIRRHRTLLPAVLLAFLIGADAPSLDPHQERTFATIELAGD